MKLTHHPKIQLPFRFPFFYNILNITHNNLLNTTPMFPPDDEKPDLSGIHPAVFIVAMVAIMTILVVLILKL